MRKRLLLAAMLLAPLALATPSPALADSFIDPSGDNGTSADIGAVSVATVADGRIEITADIANMPAGLAPGAVLVTYDTDRNPATGLAGAEYILLLDWESLDPLLARWSGTTLEPATSVGPIGVLVTRPTGARVALALSSASLGGATGFDFSVSAWSGPSDTPFDSAPDQGTWAFGTGAPVAVEMGGIAARWAPAQPRAGKTFRMTGVRVQLTDGKIVAPARVACVATLAGKRLRGTGAGGCTFKLPKSAKGKRLTVKLTATYNGERAEFEPYVFRVR